MSAVRRWNSSNAKKKRGQAQKQGKEGPSAQFGRLVRVRRPTASRARAGLFQGPAGRGESSVAHESPRQTLAQFDRSPSRVRDSPASIGLVNRLTRSVFILKCHIAVISGSHARALTSPRVHAIDSHREKRGKNPFSCRSIDWRACRDCGYAETMAAPHVAYHLAFAGVSNPARNAFNPDKHRNAIRVDARWIAEQREKREKRKSWALASD